MNCLMDTMVTESKHADNLKNCKNITWISLKILYVPPPMLINKFTKKWPTNYQSVSSIA